MMARAQKLAGADLREGCLEEAMAIINTSGVEKLSLRDVARRLGVSRQTINAVETDKYDPSLPLALRMARLFGVGVPELFIDHWEPEA